jgi:hypothetical protein
MKKSKKLNAELVNVEYRVQVLTDKVTKDKEAKNLLDKEVEVELEKIEAGAARIEGRRLKCRKMPHK